jgi:serine/threonine-protein kinase
LDATFSQAKGDLGWALVSRGNNAEKAEGLKLAREAAHEDGSATGHVQLATALATLGLQEDAIAEYRRAFAIDPDFFFGHMTLATHLERWERFDEAMAELECCRRIQPESEWVHFHMGLLLKKKGKIDEAMTELNIVTRLHHRELEMFAHNQLGDCWRAKGSPQLALLEYNRSHVLNPTNGANLRSRREVMVQLGLGVAVRTEWEDELDAYPADHRFWHGYAELCIYLDDADSYEKACHRLLDRFGSSHDPQVCERVGRACMLGVIPAADAARATELVERAVEADLPSAQAWTRPYFRVTQGLAQYRHDDFNGAIDSIGPDSRKVLGPLPHLVLAMAHQRAGHTTEALRNFAHAINICDWEPSHASGAEEWMYHAVRREAERIVMPDLAAMLGKRRPPRDQDERLALLAVCASTQRYAMATALWIEVLEADPGLADHPESGRRYSAACCAAHGGHGDGRDTEPLSDEQRSRWRTQARQWLHADLDSWSEALAARTADPGLVVGTLSHWQVSPDLASLRDEGPLASLPPDERDECRSLWSAVDAVLRRANAPR